MSIASTAVGVFTFATGALGLYANLGEGLKPFPSCEQKDVAKSIAIIAGNTLKVLGSLFFAYAMITFGTGMIAMGGTLGFFASFHTSLHAALPYFGGTLASFFTGHVLDRVGESPQAIQI